MQEKGAPTICSRKSFRSLAAAACEALTPDEFVSANEAKNQNYICLKVTCFLKTLASVVVFKGQFDGRQRV